jgi:2-methylcitrate dehydratase PrpD
MSTSPSEALAAFAATTGYQKIPKEVVQKQKELTLDLLGCALGAVRAPEAVHAYAALADLEADNGPSVVWGAGRRASCPGAALVNGILGHTLELDDTHAEGCIHPATVVVPAALATAEKTGATGKELIASIVVGYEVAIRVAIAVDPVSHRMHGWHATGTCGVLGAAAAAGSLLKLDAARMGWALGLAGVQHTGTWIFTDDGSMCKRFHAGQAAQGGVLAAFLAKAGFTGPRRILEAPDGGLFMAVSDKSDPERIFRGLGEVFEAAVTAPKPFSCCRHEHSTLHGVLKIVEKHHVKAGDVKEVRVKTNSSAYRSVGKIVEPKTVAESQFSLPFSIGLALVDGRVFHDQFTPERFIDPAVLAVARKVKVVLDPEVDSRYPKHWSADVEIETGSGVFREFVGDPPGEPGNPLPESYIRDKFRHLAKAALSDETAGKMEEMVLSIESVSSVKQLSSLLSATG